jgi:hypothetical protein
VRNAPALGDDGEVLAREQAECAVDGVGGQRARDVARRWRPRAPRKCQAAVGAVAGKRPPARVVAAYGGRESGGKDVGPAARAAAAGRRATIDNRHAPSVDTKTSSPVQRSCTRGVGVDVRISSIRHRNLQIDTTCP